MLPLPPHSQHLARWPFGVTTASSFRSNPPCWSVERSHFPIGILATRAGIALPPVLTVWPVSYYSPLWIGTPRPSRLRQGRILRLPGEPLCPTGAGPGKPGRVVLSSIVLMFCFFCVSFVQSIQYGFSWCFLLALIWIVYCMVVFFLWARCAVGPIPEGLGVACFFPRPAEEVFDRHSLGSKRGLVFVFIVILVFKAEVCTFKQINSRI